MNWQAAPLRPEWRGVAVVVAAVFLLGAAVPVIAYVAGSGLDIFAGYAAGVIVLGCTMTMVGVSRRPDRWRIVGVVAMFLCAFSFVPLMLSGWFLAPIGRSSSNESGVYLVVTGLLLIPAAPFVAIVGRPRPNRH